MLQLSPRPVSLRFKQDLKERAITNELKCKPEAAATVELLPNESHATANGLNTPPVKSLGLLTVKAIQLSDLYQESFSHRGFHTT